MKKKLGLMMEVKMRGNFRENEGRNGKKWRKNEGYKIFKDKYK